RRGFCHQRHSCCSGRNQRCRKAGWTIARSRSNPTLPARNTRDVCCYANLRGDTASRFLLWGHVEHESEKSVQLARRTRRQLRKQDQGVLQSSQVLTAAAGLHHFCHRERRAKKEGFAPAPNPCG